MRIIDGLDYYNKLDEMIKECVTKAKEQPFDRFIFIVEDKNMVEERFFQYTPYLVNIEIMSWNDYLKKLIEEYQISDNQLATNCELVYYLRGILLENKLHCFHVTNPYPLIEELIPLMKQIELNEMYCDVEPAKLADYMTIYRELKGKLKHPLTLESIVDHIDFKHTDYLYIEADHLYEPLKQNIIQKLDHGDNVTLLYTHTNDERLFNKPFDSLCKEAKEYNSSTFLTENLFSQYRGHCPEDKELYTFNEASSQSEVKRVVYTILQNISDYDEHYNDYIIAYPNTDYLNILLDTLKDVPCNTLKTTSCLYDQEYQEIIDYLDHHEQNLSVEEFSRILLNNDMSERYESYFKALEGYKDKMSASEFKDFFTHTFSDHTTINNNKEDVITIVPIDKLKSARKKHVYILGMNDTVLPHTIKDTSLLLDEDIELLRNRGITTPFTTLEKLGLHYNDIVKALQCPYYTMTFSYATSTLTNDENTPSSLYQQLKEMYDLKPLEPLRYLPVEDYYLNNGQIDTKEEINQNIQFYKESHNQVNYLNKDTVKEIYQSHLSVSLIEEYNKCPFLYFIEYGLGIHYEEEDTLQPNELGSLVHYVFSKTMNTDHYNSDSLVNHYLMKNKKLLDKVNRFYVNSYFIEQLKKDLVLTCQVLHHMMDSSLFKTVNQEERLEDEIKGIQFTGFVDRVDSFDHYMSIIDYKSSDKNIDLNLALQGFNIQMLVYLDMLCDKYDKDPAALFYFNYKKRILKSNKSMYDDIAGNDLYKEYRYNGYVVSKKEEVIKALDPKMKRYSTIVKNFSYSSSKGEYSGHIIGDKALNLLLEAIENHIYELYQAILEGIIDIKPKGSTDKKIHSVVNPCSYCHYSSICHYDVFYNENEEVEKLNVQEILGEE